LEFRFQGSRRHEEAGYEADPSNPKGLSTGEGDDPKVLDWVEVGRAAKARPGIEQR